MYLTKKASQQQVREALKAQKSRQEIVKALSHGQVSRRELLKWGLFTAGGMLAMKGGLNPFVGNSWADSIPTGMPLSPLFGVTAFSGPMPRCDVLKRNPMSSLSPVPTKEANTTSTYNIDPALVGGKTGLKGPAEGRPPGPIWAHQGWEKYQPQVAVEVWQRGASPCFDYNPQVANSLNNGINPSATVPCSFHPQLPVQNPGNLWTFDGNAPPKLLLARYGEPVLFRHHNDLNPDVTKNGGFGRNTISTHEHNGHHGAENDGFAGAFFHPGQFYDYHWPIVHAGANSPAFSAADDPRCGSPNGAGGITKLPGDWHETMSTHWFHDHMFSFTSQNVYKGVAAMFNLYSSIDRGNETIKDAANLRLPSGKDKDWGNLDYDVNLMLADKAFDQSGQMAFDIFDFDGFLGDTMTVNLAYKPYFEVERRKYRFRILNASVSRFFKLALSDGSQIIQIGNDGNLLPAPVYLSELDQQGIAERYDVVIDFSRYPAGANSKVWLVNLAEHQDGKRVANDLSLTEALSGKSPDPCVGKFLEFRIAREPAYPDQSVVPPVLIPNPDLSKIPVARERTIEFGSGAAPLNTATSATGPWGSKVDGGAMLAADIGRVSAAPKAGTREVWTLKNGGGGWDHPIHIHFEEAQILARDGKARNVPPWERGRKDVFRLRPGGTITITLQFRDWGGMFMEHCHNTVHEDNAMLLRWEIDDSGSPFLRPLPTPIPTPQGVTFQNSVLPNGA